MKGNFIRSSMNGSVRGKNRLLFLTLVGSVLLSQTIVQAQAPWVQNGNDINNTNSGNVGIGTTSPGANLEVIGNQILSGTLTVGDRTVVKSTLQRYSPLVSSILLTSSPLIATNEVAVHGQTVVRASPNVINAIGGVFTAYVDDAAGGVTNFLQGVQGFASQSLGTVGGAAGTGSWGGVFMNEISGGTNQGTLWGSRSRALMTGGTVNVDVIAGYFGNSITAGTVSGNTYGIYVDSGSDGTVSGTRYGGLFNLQNATTKGIVVKGAASQTGNLFEAQDATGTPLVLISGGGNVGIGTTSPNKKLVIYESTNAAADIISGTNSQIAMERGATGFDSAVSFRTTGGNSSDWLIGMLGATYGTGNDFVIGAPFDAAKVTIKTNGNVGIGTTTPTEKLEVAGNAKITGNLDVAGNLDVDGNLAAKYQDVAEWVKSSKAMLPGTVAILDPAFDNQVLPSDKAYDIRVAGVISTQPGIALGEKGAEKVLVAATGRVKVKATASNGPIAIGDLLVTSGQKGTAMRSAPVKVSGISIHRPGTVLGKALQSLKDGDGEILVLLTLQ